MKAHLACAFTNSTSQRATRAAIPDGRGLLRGVDAGRDADALLREGGLMPGATRIIDADAGVDLTVYTRT